MGARAQLRAIDPAKYHPVMLAISKAQAAAWLLEELLHGNICHQEEIHDWLTMIASDTLREELGRAQEEFIKSPGTAGAGGA